MTPLAGERLLVSALGLLCVVFLGVALAPWLVDPMVTFATGPSAHAVTDRTEPAPPPAFELPPIDHFAAVVDRPIFTATRRPARGHSTDASAAADDGLILGRYRMIGVVVAPDRRLILLKRPDGARTIHVAEGEKIDDWTLARVTRNVIVLESGGRRKEILVREKSKAKDRRKQPGTNGPTQ